MYQFTDPDHAYLADFGITKHAMSRTGPTSTGQFLGAIDYVAPEQIRDAPVAGLADQYSLGCVLYECLTRPGAVREGPGRGDHLGTRRGDAHHAHDPAARPAERPRTSWYQRTSGAALYAWNDCAREWEGTFMANPCAFILVRFADDPSTPISVNEAETLFTVRGRGRMYLVDYFDEITHGRVDMSGNAVFGWYDLGWTRQDYLDQRARTGDRTVLIAEARRAARANGAPVDSFVATIVASNGPGPAADFYGGYWAGQGYAQTTADQGPGNTGRESKVSPAALCQEIVHALGVPQHTRRTGSDADYQDPFDVMSLWTTGTPAPHPENPDYVIGPGINAAFLDRCGWLDQSRGVEITHSGSYQLRPLHRRDLPGNLFARFGDQYIEYRPKLRWDAGQAESVVLVHHRANLTSYLDEVHVSEDPPRDPPFQIFDRPTQMWVSSIDDDALIATVEVRVPPREPVAGPAVSLFGTDAGGGGLVQIGGKLHRIPPRSPSFALLERVVALEETFTMGVPPALQLQVQQQILTQLAGTVTAQLDETKVPHPEHGAER